MRFVFGVACLVEVEGEVSLYRPCRVTRVHCGGSATLGEDGVYRADAAVACYIKLGMHACTRAVAVTVAARSIVGLGKMTPAGQKDGRLELDINVKLEN